MLVFHLVPLSWEGKWTFGGGVENGFRNFGGAKPSSSLESRGTVWLRVKPRIEGAKRPRIEGEARVEGAKRLMLENRGRSRSRRRKDEPRGSPRKNGGGV